MNIEQQKQLKTILDKIGNYNEGAKLTDNTLVIYNKCGYNATTLNIEDLHALSNIIKGKVDEIKFLEDLKKCIEYDVDVNLTINDRLKELMGLE